MLEKAPAQPVVEERSLRKCPGVQQSNSEQGAVGFGKVMFGNEAKLGQDDIKAFAGFRVKPLGALETSL